MGIYNDTEQVYNVLGNTWRRAFAEESIATKFKAMGIYVHFVVHEPEGEMWLMPDATVHEGPWDGTPDKPVVTMEMKTDVAHEFWMDRLNVPVATARGQIKAKGPVAKIFGLLPVVKPAKVYYPEIAKKYGVDVSGK